MDAFAKCGVRPSGSEAQASALGAHHRVLQSGPGAEVVVDGRRMVMLGGSDFLGLAAEPQVRCAAAEAVVLWGPGGAGSPLDGALGLQRELERRLAGFLQREAALVYGSGYLAAMGVVSTLARGGEVVVVDRPANAGILDGCRLSGAEVRRFRRDVPGDLERVLDSCAGAGALVVVEGTHPLHGELAPLPRIVQACRGHGVRVVVDDAQGVGVLGPHGRGAAEQLGVEDEVDVIVGATGAAIAGPGGFVAASRSVVEHLRHARADRPFLFAPSPPPAALAAALASLDLVETEPGLRARLWNVALRVHRALGELGFELAAEPSPVVALPVGTVERALEAWRALDAEGLYVNVVLPPAVPARGCLIRLALSASLTEAHVERLVGALARTGPRLGLLGPAAGRAAARSAG